MSEKLNQVLRLLLKETQEGRTEWELFEEDDMIRAKVANGLLRIQREPVRTLENASDGRVLEGVEVFNIWVINKKGVVCDEYAVTPFEPEDYKLVDEVFVAGRRKSRNAEEVLDDMIRALSAKR